MLITLIEFFFSIGLALRYREHGTILQKGGIFRRDETNPISEGLSSKVTSYKIGTRGIKPKSQCLNTGSLQNKMH